MLTLDERHNMDQGGSQGQKRGWACSIDLVLFPTESTHKEINQRSKEVTQVQQQRPESPTVTLTWHASKYKVRKLHQRYILKGETVWPSGKVLGW